MKSVLLEMYQLPENSGEDILPATFKVINAATGELIETISAKLLPARRVEFDCDQGAVLYYHPVSPRSFLTAMSLGEVPVKKTDIDTRLNELNKERDRLQGLARKTRTAGELAKAIEKRDIAALKEMLLDMDITAREFLPLACAVYTRMADELKDTEFELPGLNSDGITYYGGGGVNSKRVNSVVLPPMYHLNRMQSHLKASSGAWSITKAGDFEFSAAQVVFHETCLGSSDDTVSINSAMITDGTISSVSKGEAPRPSILMEDADGHVWRVAHGAHVSADTHFNDPQHLPPVPCAVLIKVPDDTEVVFPDGRGCNTVGDKILPAFRTKFIDDKRKDMEYQLSDGGIIKGRLWWTYP